MQEQPTCRRCGAPYDPLVDFDGKPKTKRSGRPRTLCSRRCAIAQSNAKKGNGGDGSWPRSKAIEETVCGAYLTGESCNALAEAFETSGESPLRFSTRRIVTIRSRNAPTPRKLYRGGMCLDSSR